MGQQHSEFVQVSRLYLLPFFSSRIQTTADSEDDESEEDTSVKTVFEEPKEEVP